LLGALAAALPREHRAPEPRLRPLPPCRADPPVPVHQQPPGDLRQPDVEERERVQLIPEHVPPVGLPVQPPGRQPRTCSTSQFGRFTRSSFSTGSPPPGSSSPGYTPHARTYRDNA